MVRAAMEGIALIGLDGNVTEANEEAVQMFGFRSEDELLGRNALELLAQRDRKRAMVDIQEAFQEGAVRYIECSLTRADGSEHPAEIRASVKRDASGNPVGFIGIIRGTTEREWSAQAAQKAREYAESVLDTVRESLVVLDAHQRVISANRFFYRTFQVTPEETEGQLLYALGNHQWDIPSLRELLEEILPKNTSIEGFEMEHYFPNIGRRTMMLNARRIYTEMNRTEMVLLAIEDISDRKAMQEELVRKEKLATLGQLAGGLGHELRNPLASIKSSAYLLNRLLEQPDPKVKRALDALDREVLACERIISSLLDFVRQRPPLQRRVDINNIVRQALSRANIPQNVEVVSQLDETLPAANADPDRLGTVFANIILNAVQAMPEGGRLIVKSEVPDPDWAAFSFADTGVGIAAENLPKLFEPLFTTKARGIGLGLPMVKTLVEAHGGTIEIQSEVGKGSTFTVKLPIRREVA
jgi:two-component system CheB/CheR fusion protein